MSSIRIAVEGCAHGELDAIYDAVRYAQEVEGKGIDLLICCGDFQAVRNEQDLECMACPLKYRHMHDFFRYYSGERVAPVPTVFVGGNHEASNYLQELPLGGWVAPNIYYLGRAGVVRFAGLRIAGLSGIYNRRHFRQGFHERPPYDRDTMRSVYHVREFDCIRLSQLHPPVDLMVTHDWPGSITDYGNKEELLRRKRFLREDIERNELGNPATMPLVHQLRPRLWFAAHLHVKFAALVPHPDEPVADSSGEDESRVGSSSTPARDVTRFLSLDKCLPRRDFLQVLDVPCASDAPKKLCFDPEWLAIVQQTHLMQPLDRRDHSASEFSMRAPTEQEIEAVAERLQTAGVDPPFFPIPAECPQTVRPFQCPPGFDPSGKSCGGRGGGRGGGGSPWGYPGPRQHQPGLLGNPQTDRLLEWLGLPHRDTVPSAPSAEPPAPATTMSLADRIRAEAAAQGMYDGGIPQPMVPPTKEEAPAAEKPHQEAAARPRTDVGGDATKPVEDPNEMALDDI